jgi:hypothetical protein
LLFDEPFQNAFVMKDMLTLGVAAPNDSIAHAIVAQTNGTTIGNLFVLICIESVVVIVVSSSRQLQKATVGKGEIFRRLVVNYIVIISILWI